MQVLDELVRQTKVPGFDLVASYEAAVPVYDVRLRLNVLRVQRLPTIAEFVLKLANDGVTSGPDIALMLGIERGLVNQALSHLNQLSLLTVAQRDGNGVELAVTPRGREALEQALASVQSEMLELRLDGLTGALSERAGSKLYDSEALKKGTSAHPLPVAHNARPSLQSLNDHIDDLQEILLKQMDDLRQVRPRHLSEPDTYGQLNKVIEVTEILGHWLKYKLANVLVFRNHENCQVQFRVFEGLYAVEDYDDILTDQLRAGRIKVVPSAILIRKNEVASNASDPELSQEVLRLVTLSHKVTDARSEVGHARQLLADTEQQVSPDPDEMTAKSRRIKDLEDHIASILADLTEAERQLGSTRPVFDTEHRDLLKKALTDAQSSVVIVSPWIKRPAVDSEITRLIKGCLQRNVLVVIAYGMRPRYANQSFIDDDLQKEFDRIAQKPNGHLLHMENIAKTHEKIVICDRRFCVVTSNNFLSFNGDYSIKQETGLYSESADIIRKLMDRAIGSLSHPPAALAHGD